MLRVDGVKKDFQQGLVTMDSTTVLRRAGPLTRDTLWIALPLLSHFNAQQSKLVDPAITEIIFLLGTIP
jgi:hypothetical protein